MFEAYLKSGSNIKLFFQLHHLFIASSFVHGQPLVINSGLLHARADSESFIRGGPTLTTFFFFFLVDEGR